MKHIIAIDGPAGAGKSTASKLLAKKLGYLYIDSGAMYRSVALIAKQQGVNWENETAISDIAEKMNFHFEDADNGIRCIVNNADITDQLRTPDISHGSSVVAQYPKVRFAVDGIQRELGKSGGVVIEGRDVSTSVFPNADVKIFLTATPETRTRRRIAELQAKTGQTIDFEAELAKTKERDERDSTRIHSPLKKADDATEIYTDNMTMDEVVDRLISLLPSRPTKQ